MGLFEDLSKFLETRLEEFLKSNPHLELQALDEQLKDQEQDTLRLIASLSKTQKNLEEQILSTATEIKKWHIRIEKAKQANRLDLAQPAAEREASLLREGNQLWNQMQLTKQKIAQSKELLNQIQARRQEVQIKAAQINKTPPKTAANTGSSGWFQSGKKNYWDDLEQKFHDLEVNEELDRMKRNMNR